MDEFEALAASDDELRGLYENLTKVANDAANSLRTGGASSVESVMRAESVLQQALDAGWRRIEATSHELMRGISEARAASLVHAIREHQTHVALVQAQLDEANERAASTDWITPFADALAKVHAAVERACGSKAPWELEYHLVRSREDEEDGVVSFVGGAIVDADGRPLWRLRAVADAQLGQRQDVDDAAACQRFGQRPAGQRHLGWRAGERHRAQEWAAQGAAAGAAAARLRLRHAARLLCRLLGRPRRHVDGRRRDGPASRLWRRLDRVPGATTMA